MSLCSASATTEMTTALQQTEDAARQQPLLQQQQLQQPQLQQLLRKAADALICKGFIRLVKDNGESMNLNDACDIVESQLLSTNDETRSSSSAAKSNLETKSSIQENENLIENLMESNRILSAKVACLELALEESTAQMTEEKRIRKILSAIHHNKDVELLHKIKALNGCFEELMSPMSPKVIARDPFKVSGAGSIKRRRKRRQSSPDSHSGSGIIPNGNSLLPQAAAAGTSSADASLGVVENQEKPKEHEAYLENQSQLGDNSTKESSERLDGEESSVNSTDQLPPTEHSNCKDNASDRDRDSGDTNLTEDHQSKEDSATRICSSLTVLEHSKEVLEEVGNQDTEIEVKNKRTLPPEAFEAPVCDSKSCNTSVVKSHLDSIPIRSIQTKMPCRKKFHSNSPKLSPNSDPSKGLLKQDMTMTGKSTLTCKSMTPVIETSDNLETSRTRQNKSTLVRPTQSMCKATAMTTFRRRPAKATKSLEPVLTSCNGDPSVMTTKAMKGSSSRSGGDSRSLHSAHSFAPRCELLKANKSATGSNATTTSRTVTRSRTHQGLAMSKSLPPSCSPQTITSAKSRCNQLDALTSSSTSRTQKFLPSSLKTPMLYSQSLVQGFFNRN